MKKLLVDGFTTKITCPTRSFRVLVYPSGIDVSTSTLRYLSTRLRTRRQERGPRWRRLSAGRQALLVIAPHLRSGHTSAQLAAGFGAGTATAYRYIAEAIDVLAALAPTIAEAMTGLDPEC